MFSVEGLVRLEGSVKGEEAKGGSLEELVVWEKMGEVQDVGVK